MRNYLHLLQQILDQGHDKSDRTGVGTRSLFACQLRHDLTTGFPLLTTKKIHFKSIAYELLWFLRGETNNQWLQEHGVRIWNEWADEKGDLGPIYGKQWTAWNTASGDSINQIQYVMELIQHNPDSRRILFHGWNVADLPDEKYSPQDNVAAGRMALPPCHLLYQFYVQDGYLSCQLYIRSSDSFLGLPFNIASVALLTHMIANQTNLIAKEIIVTTGDSHIYHNHRAAVDQQLIRTPKSLPKLTITRQAASIFDYQFEDFLIEDYDPAPAIKASVAV